MFMELVMMTSGRVGKPCRCTIWEKTGNVVAHLLSYLLHLMFVALWRKPVICRCPYGSAGAENRGSSIPPASRQCEASPADKTPEVEIDSLLFGCRVYDPGQTNPNIRSHLIHSIFIFPYVYYWVMVCAQDLP